MEKKGNNARMTSVASKTLPISLESVGRQKIRQIAVPAPVSHSSRAFDHEISLRLTLLAVAKPNPNSEIIAAPNEMKGKAGLQRVSTLKRSTGGATQCSQLTLRGAYRQVKFKTAKVSSIEQVVIAKANFQ